MSVGGSTDASYSGQSFFFLAPLFIPLVILGVPILDTLFAIVRRASRRAGVATADKEHLHHRLLRLGHGHRRAVFILWTWTALLSGSVLFPVLTNRGDALVPLALGGLALLLYTVLHPGARRTRVEVRRP
jgi:UDP-GlcNAc:undecaprenyl-phosphate GlcNAc-1-phosphate transferase